MRFNLQVQQAVKQAHKMDAEIQDYGDRKDKQEAQTCEMRKTKLFQMVS